MLNESAKNSLIQGAKDLGVSLNEHQFNQLDAYLELLLKWNKVFNLTSIRDPEEGGEKASSRLPGHHSGIGEDAAAGTANAVTDGCGIRRRSSGRSDRGLLPGTQSAFCRCCRQEDDLHYSGSA